MEWVLWLALYSLLCAATGFLLAIMYIARRMD